MEIIRSEFVKSSEKLSDLPAPELPEYAFVGRSNVGKSSLINMLCKRKKLAHTSSTPGKTQCINHFLINDEWYLVDLPGYGYAKVSKKKREFFTDMIHDYLIDRINLMNIFVLIDSRIPPQKNDLEFLEFLGVKGLPFTIIFTKTDKPGVRQLEQNLKAFQETLLETWESLPPMIQSSSVSKTGREEILNYIEEINPIFYEES